MGWLVWMHVNFAKTAPPRIHRTASFERANHIQKYRLLNEEDRFL